MAIEKGRGLKGKNAISTVFIIINMRK